MTEVRLSHIALQDISELKQYITEEAGSDIPAKKTAENLLKHIGMLSTFPEIGTPLSSVVKFDTPYRFLVCGNYHVFYRVENSTVLVLRILHNRRNYMQILFGISQDEE